MFLHSATLTHAATIDCTLFRSFNCALTHSLAHWFASSLVYCCSPARSLVCLFALSVAHLISISYYVLRWVCSQKETCLSQNKRKNIFRCAIIEIYICRCTGTRKLEHSLIKSWLNEWNIYVCTFRLLTHSIKHIHADTENNKDSNNNYNNGSGNNITYDLRNERKEMYVFVARSNNDEERNSKADDEQAGEENEEKEEATVA